MGILGTVEDHEILAYLGGFDTQLSAEQLDDFKTWCKANPQGDWDTRARQMFADPAEAIVNTVVEKHASGTQVTISVNTPPKVTIPTLDEISRYVAGCALDLGGEDFVSFAAYCQAHPDGSWARMLQVIAGEAEPRPSAEHERCANCHRWVFRVTSESGTNIGWLHQHTNTATGQQNRTCGHSGELGSVGKPASLVITAAEVWRVITNLIADPEFAPTPRSVRVDPLADRGGYAPRVTIVCEPGAIGDVLRWAEIFGIPGTGRVRQAAPGNLSDRHSYYLAAPLISLMDAHDDGGLDLLPGWEFSARTDLDEHEMATWAVKS